jgi:CheY-like chemotaxis protein
VSSPCPIRNLLLIEDSPVDAWIISKVLQKMHLCEDVTVTTTGREALRHLATHRHTERYPQVILLDLLMPDMNGFEFIERALREKLPLQHGVRTIMLTSSLLPIDKRQAALYPLAGYLHKPLIAAELLATLQGGGLPARFDW